MRHSSLALAASLLTSATAFTLVQRENPKVIGLDIQRVRNVINPVARDQLRRRQNTVQQTLDNLETLYFANASLGTPAQKFRLHIDTGSSDLWVNAENSVLCSERGNQCAESGTYDANSSSTYEFVNNFFNISYVDGSSAAGDYVKDTIEFGGQKIEGLQFGIGYVSSSQQGILGIGYTANEVQVNRAGGRAYPNLPQLMADNGLINTNAYSLWLNDLDASTGSILFGGVDTEKYEGELSKLPIIPNQGVYAEFVIAMTGLTMGGDSLFSGDGVSVLLDSGSSLMYLPDDITRSLYSTFSAVYDNTQGAAFVDCSVADQSGSLDFEFSGVKISVPMNELVVVVGSRGNQPVCILGIGPAGDSTCVLGDTFLRSAYVVYDLENNEIALAQTNFNATRSSVEEINAGSDGVPNAAGVASAVSTIAGATGGARNGGPQISATAGQTAGAVPMPTANPWLGAGAAVAGAGLLMGFNGL